MADEKVTHIKPKSEHAVYEGQSYTCTFDPHAIPDRRWFYHIKYKREYDVVGARASLQQAHQAARKHIRDINKDVSNGRA